MSNDPRTGYPLENPSDLVDEMTRGPWPVHTAPAVEPPPAVRKWVSAAESAAIIRAALRRNLGLTSRDVSVRCSNFSMGSAVDLTIRRVGISYRAVEAIANTQEKIDRCSVTGEILSGSNRYISVRFASEVEDILAAAYLPFLESLAVTGPGNAWSTGPLRATVTGLWRDDSVSLDSAVYVRRVTVDRFELSLGGRTIPTGNALTAAFTIASFYLRRS